MEELESELKKLLELLDIHAFLATLSDPVLEVLFFNLLILLLEKGLQSLQKRVLPEHLHIAHVDLEEGEESYVMVSSLAIEAIASPAAEGTNVLLRVFVGGVMVIFE